MLVLLLWELLVVADMLLISDIITSTLDYRKMVQKLFLGERQIGTIEHGGILAKVFFTTDLY